MAGILGLVMKLGKLNSIRLDGAPPSQLGLAALEGYEKSISYLKESFRNFADSDIECISKNVQTWQDLDYSGLHFPEDSNIFCVVYIIGHAWSGRDGSFLAPLKDRDGDTQLVSGEKIAQAISNWCNPNTNILVIVDTCEASAIKLALLKHLTVKNALFIFCSDQKESAWELRFDQATHFSIAWLDSMKSVAKESQDVDLFKVIMQTKDKVSRKGILEKQEISFYPLGEIYPTTVQRNKLPKIKEKTSLAVRNAMILLGFVLGFFVLGSIVFFLFSSFVVIDLEKIDEITYWSHIKIFQNNPEANSRRLIKSIPVGNGGEIWARLPVENLSLELDALFSDGKNRELRFHLDLRKRSFREVLFKLDFPSANEILGHPNMAYVSAREWLSGPEAERSKGPGPYWIDIAPIGIGDYLPWVFQAFSEGNLRDMDSVLLFNFISGSEVAGPGLIKEYSFEKFRVNVMSSDLFVCGGNCPVPLTPIEAEVFLRSQGKRLPTRDEWELAVRGVDGRLFPWGNNVVYDFINAGLPSQKGRREIQPINDMPQVESPFGLVDTVGNAGDWVAIGSEKVGFMGGYIDNNPEDCLSFNFSPIPSAHYTYLLTLRAWWITARGVSNRN